MFQMSVKDVCCNKDYEWVGVPNGTPFKLWGVPLLKWGIKIKYLPTARERRKELFNILVTTYILD